MKKENDKMKKTAGSVLLIIGAVLILTGTLTLFNINSNPASEISIIGGADGPTVVFLASRIGMPLLAAIIIGAVLVIIGIIVLLKKKKDK